jgi:hypothetical protein
MNATAEAPALPEDRLAKWKARAASQDGKANGGGGGAVYGIGMIGALVYFFQSAGTGRDKALAAPKAIFWPALLVYKLLKQVNG